MAGFAPTMWKMAQLPDDLVVRNRHLGEECTDNIPEFSK